ncbi:MAG: serine/threonine-protein kinase [Polyangiales bacterium]
MSNETLEDSRVTMGAAIANPPRDTAHAATIVAEDAELSASMLGAAPPAVNELPEASFEPEPSASAEESGAPGGDGRSDLVAHRTLGQGGMGRVLLATQRSLRRRVAVKTANERRASAVAIVREGVVTGMLEHPNIPPVHALLRGRDGRPVLVMKHIEGVSWSDVLADRGHPLRKESPLFIGLDEREANLEILVQLCNALDFAHARGIVHRDVKPENVMLGRFGEVYLIDWGIAFNASWHSTNDSIPLLGTAAYMAPEMVLCEPPDARTDVYLLGATLHCVLVGAPPHEAETVDASLSLALESKEPRYDESIASELAALCRWSMARDRDERPPNVRAFREALQAFRMHRASNAICDETDKRLDSLLSLLAAPARDESERGRLLLECRFGYGQALKEWPDNARATDGLRRLHTALARDEIALENPRGARTHAAEIPGGDPEIERAIEALEAKVAADRAHDFQQSARERRLFLSATVVFVAGVQVWRMVSPVSTQSLRSRHLGLLVVALGLDVFVGAVLAVLWKRLARSSVNRKLAFGVGSAFVGVTLNRLMGLLFLPGASVTLVADGLIIASSVAAVSRFVAPALLWAIAPLLLGIVAMCVDPSRTPLYYNVSAIVFALLVIGIFRRHERDPRSSRA